MDGRLEGKLVGIIPDGFMDGRVDGKLVEGPEEGESDKVGLLEGD